MLEIQDLMKVYAGTPAVNGLSLRVPPGICMGLLGPNGAGKSTLIRMIYGVTQASAGSVRVFGLDPWVDGRTVKKRLGVVTQENALDESLTVEENMLLYAAYQSVPRGERRARMLSILEELGLSKKLRAPVRALSGGMKRRMVFARALLGRPEFLILDEPTTGLDPAVRHSLWGLVRKLKSTGVTILLTTHYMHEAEALSDQIIIIDHGKKIAQGTPRDLISRHAPGEGTNLETVFLNLTGHGLEAKDD